jgi:hypothetical protein
MLQGALGIGSNLLTPRQQEAVYNGNYTVSGQATVPNSTIDPREMILVPQRRLQFDDVAWLTATNFGGQALTVQVSLTLYNRAEQVASGSTEKTLAPGEIAGYGEFTYDGNNADPATRIEVDDITVTEV